MNAKVAALVANAVVVGRPVWTPAVIAALATLFHESRRNGAGAADPAPTDAQEYETWPPRPQTPLSQPE
jgi:hypothetical protein